MSRKSGRFALLIIAFLVAAVALRYVHSRAPLEPPGDWYDRVRWGMTEAEITSILGCPPGDYRTQDVIYVYSFNGPISSMGFLGSGGIEKEWNFDSCDVRICFKNGPAQDIHGGTGIPFRRSWIDRLRLWLEM